MHALRCVFGIARAEIFHMNIGGGAYPPIGCARMLSAEGGLLDDLRAISGFIYL